MMNMKYVFGKQSSEGISVSKETLYGDGQSFGFIGQTNLLNPDLSNNFTLPFYLKDEMITELIETEEGITLDSAAVCERVEAEPGRLVPIYFISDVPEYGNYEITVTLKGEGTATVFSGTRRMVFRDELKSGVNTVSFIQNAGKIIPRGFTEVHERKHVSVTVLGEKVCLSSIEIKAIDCPTLYICGDSTVTDQSAEFPYAPGTSYSGWGQMLPDHIKGVAVSNHAHSGLTVESFRSEGHYGIIEECIKPGDFICFQFAHNDQKLLHLKAYEGYSERVVQYIKEARAKGAYPFLITPLARNTWKADGSGYNDLLWEYAEALTKLSKDYNVPLVDLHAFSMEEILRDGLESSKRYYFPKDYTHTNDFGAYKMSVYIAGEIKKFSGDYKKLADSVNISQVKWDTDKVPVVPPVPEKYAKDKETAKDNSLFAKLEREREKLLRAEALDFVIKTCRFFPTNVFNDLYDDIVGHEWYAGAVQCAYQNGLIPAEMIKDKCFRPFDKVTLQDFICFIMAGYRSRKTMPKETECSFDGTCEEYAKTFLRAAVSLGILKGTEDLQSEISRRQAADICTSLNI